MHLIRILILLSLLLRLLLLLLINRRPIRNPILLLLKLALLNILLDNSVVLAVQSLQVKDVENVVDLVVVDACVFLEPLELEVDVETLLAAHVAE